MHQGLWETIADTLFWLQLCWVISGFFLMAYLAFKVLPNNGKSDADGTSEREPSRTGILKFTQSPWSDGQRSQPFFAGNYRLEAFPPTVVASGEVLEFPSIVPEENRRLS